MDCRNAGIEFASLPGVTLLASFVPLMRPDTHTDKLEIRALIDALAGTAATTMAVSGRTARKVARRR